MPPLLSRALKPVNKLYFDTNFLRRLVGLPEDFTHRKWQEFFFEMLNKKFLPLSCLSTPFQFLELIGVVPPKRPTVPTLIPPNWRELDDNKNGEVISDRLGEIFETTIDYYRSQPELASGELISKSNIQANLWTSKNQFARFLAFEIFQRFKAHDGFEETLYSWLALDNIQHQLLREPVCRIAPLAHMTVLKNLIALFADEYNATLFRCLRSIYLSIERGILERGQSTLLPLKGRKDLVDTECIHFALLGVREKGETKAITIFTCDSPEDIKMRIKIGRQIFELFSEGILETVLLRSNIVLPPLAPGRVICCDFREEAIVEEIIVNDLSRDIEIS